MGGVANLVKSVFGSGGGFAAAINQATAPAAPAANAAPELRGTDKNMADTQSFQDMAARRNRMSGAATLAGNAGAAGGSGTKSLLGS